MTGYVRRVAVSIGILLFVTANPAYPQDIYGGVLAESEAKTPNISTDELKGILQAHFAARRVATDLVTLGYTHVRRYQLGIPVWRALGGVTEIELQGIQHVLAADQTAVFIDTRDAEQLNSGALANARDIQARYVEAGSGGEEIATAKDAGHVAEALTKSAFHDVSFFDGSYSDIGTISTP